MWCDNPLRHDASRDHEDFRAVGEDRSGLAMCWQMVVAMGYFCMCVVEST